MGLGDRLVVMDHGRIQQIGTPQELYRAPANLFVASFVGSGNFLAGRADAARGRFVTASGLAFACPRLPPDAELLLIRPEAVKLGEAALGSADAMEATVEAVSFFGALSEVTLRLGSGERLVAQLASSDLERQALEPAAAVAVRVDPEALVALPRGTERN